MRNARSLTAQLLCTPLRSAIGLPCGYGTPSPILFQYCRSISSARSHGGRTTLFPPNPLKRTNSKREGFQNHIPPSIPFYGHARSRSTVSRAETATRRFRARWLVGGMLLILVAGSALGLESFRSEPKVFDPPRFTPFTIVKREVVSPTSIILTLRPLTPLIESTPDLYKECWEKGIWSVEVKQPELQIARSYTPLPPIKPDENSSLRFLIRKEHKGEVSGYLHGLGVGWRIELRGPHPGFDLPDNVGEVVFLAGGTGIAPAMQAAYTLLERRNTGEDQTRIRVVWSNRRREDCKGAEQMENEAPTVEMQRHTGQIVLELQALQQRHPGQLTVDYLVDEENSFLDQRKISQVISESEKMRTGSKFLFISGPEGFVNYFAGPKKWEGRKEGQGEVGGVLGRMRLKDWTVWKL